MIERERNMDKIDMAVNDFAGLVREYRVANGLSLLEWSEVIGYSSSYCWRIEQSKRQPDFDTKIIILTRGMCWSTNEIYAYLDRIISTKALEKEKSN